MDWLVIRREFRSVIRRSIPMIDLDTWCLGNRYELIKYMLVRKDMDVIEHERLSNINREHKLIVKEQHVYFYSTFQSTTHTLKMR